MIEVTNQTVEHLGPTELATLKAKAQRLYSALKDSGYHPKWQEAIESGMIGIGFDIMRGKGEPWLKAFLVDGKVATPAAFILQMDEWKAKVLRDIALNMPSPVVAGLIVRQGLDKVKKALAA